MKISEILLNAAKAVGGNYEPKTEEFRLPVGNVIVIQEYWNPIEKSGDALELAVKLGLRVYVYNGGGDDCTLVAGDELAEKDINVKVLHEGDNLAATRLAIVKAAALIGELK